MSKYLELLYPSITDQMSAKRATAYGYAAAAVIASLSAISVTMQFYSENDLGFVAYVYRMLENVLPMSILGILIYRMSRVASAVALIYCIIEMLFKYSERETVGIFPIYILLFVSSMRGTVAFHRYKNSHSSKKTET